MASNPDIVTHPASLAAMDPPPPAHLVPVLFPAADALSEDSDTEALFDQPLRYWDAKNGKVVECTVEDCVTSRLRGKYYIVAYGEGLEEEVSEREMQEMLKNRVQ
jgi:hypothetical protein